MERGLMVPGSSRGSSPISREPTWSHPHAVSPIFHAGSAGEAGCKAYQRYNATAEKIA